MTEAKRGFWNGLGQAFGIALVGVLGVVVGAVLFAPAPTPPAPIRNENEPATAAGASLRSGGCRSW